MRLLIVSLDNEPLWVRLDVLPVDGKCAAMLAGDDLPLPEPDTETGLPFIGATPEEAERSAPRGLDVWGGQGRHAGTRIHRVNDVPHSILVSMSRSFTPLHPPPTP